MAICVWIHVRYVDTDKWKSLNTVDLSQRAVGPSERVVMYSQLDTVYGIFCEL